MRWSSLIREENNLDFGKAMSRSSWCRRIVTPLYGKSKKPTIISNNEWEELEMKVVSDICLCLAPEIKCSVWNEISPQELWKILEKIYMSKIMINQLCI